MHFFDIVKQEQPNLVKKPEDELTAISPEAEEITELVSLRLGLNTVARNKKLEEKMINTSPKSKENFLIEEGLTLGLDCKFEGYNSKNDEYKELQQNPSSDDSVEEIKEEEEEADKPCPQNKVLKNLRSGDEEVLQQTHVKKARVSVRVRCQTPTVSGFLFILYKYIRAFFLFIQFVYRNIMCCFFFSYMIYLSLIYPTDL